MEGMTKSVFGYRMTSVPLLLVAQGVMTAFTAGYVLLLRKWTEPQDRKM